MNFSVYESGDGLELNVCLQYVNDMLLDLSYVLLICLHCVCLALSVGLIKGQEVTGEGVEVENKALETFGLCPDQVCPK